MTKKFAKILTLGVLIIMSLGMFVGCIEKNEAIPKEWGDKIASEEWSAIVDSTISEFQIEDANAKMKYSFGCKIEDPRNNVWLSAKPVVKEFLIDGNIVYWDSNYFSFEDEKFYKYESESQDLYRKVVVCDIQQGENLYAHIIIYAETEREKHFDSIIKMLLDTKERFDVYKSTDGTLRFRTKNDDSFSIWNLYSFSYQEGKHHYSAKSLTGEIAVADGRIVQFSLRFFDEKVDFEFGLNFEYGGVLLSLPQ